MVAEQTHDRPDSESRRWICHPSWWNQMTTENLLAKKKMMKPNKDMLNRSRRRELAPQPDDHIDG